ncbi:uncharacterized protein METZ01_LOCUS380435, partial [marine metagenome]
MKNKLRQLIRFVVLLGIICSCVSDTESNLRPLVQDIPATVKPLA